MEDKNFGLIENCGKLIRILIHNHQKNKPIFKSEINKLLAIDNNTRFNLLEIVQNYLNKFNLKMVGVSNSELVCYENSDKIFLQKIIHKNNKRIKILASHDEKVLFFLVAVINLENNRLEERKIKLLNECKLFQSISVEEYLKIFKVQGYFIVEKIDEKDIWKFGWRYYIEFNNSNNIIDYFYDK